MLPQQEVQGLVLRSYGMDYATMFLLRVNDAKQARVSLGTLPVTSGSPWVTKPPFCLNVALTHLGLGALGLTQESLASFPTEFAEDAFRRCAEVGDGGACSPENWEHGLGAPGLHGLLLLFAQTEEICRQQTTALKNALLGSGWEQIAALNGGVLPGGKAHFGYRDGFSQPTIEGGFANPVPDRQPVAPSGEFLLGYPSQFEQLTYPVPQPETLGRNGSYLVFRMLEQNCAAFDSLLQNAEQQFGIDGELLAAKMVGRWRDGTPLSLFPETDGQGAELQAETLNQYDYVPTPDNPGLYNDRRGYRCPIGSHMRRANPRSSAVAGNSGSRHRIVRRGVPYGPPYDPAKPEDGVKRGLLGLFIGASIKDQFEFLMSEWINGSAFAPGIFGTTDPLLGNSAGDDNKFVIPREGAKPLVISPMPRLVTTRGSAYTFLPSLSGLRYLAGL